MTAAERDWHPVPEAPVNRIAELALRLAAPAGELLAPRRALPPSPRDRLRCLLAEIDETVLPRLLVLSLDGREVGRLTVSHRRLIAVDGADPAAGGQDLAETLAAPLRRLAALRGEMRLTMRRRTTVPAGPEPACGMAALARVLAPDLGPAGDPFDRLMARLAPLALAQFQWDAGGGPARFAGASDLRGLLEGLARQQLAPPPRPAPPLGPRIGPAQLDGLVLPLDRDRIFLLARREGRGLAALLPRGPGLEALAAWQAGC
jgi:hypothetical protein